MARDGNGNYNLPAGQPVVNGTTISSSVFNTFTADVATALTQSVSKDGQTTMSGSLPMGNNKIIDLANGTVPTDAINLGQLQLVQFGVNVKSYGALGDGITDDTAAFLAARDTLQANNSFRGGKIYVPRGHYKLSAAWAFTAYAAGTLHSMFIIGDGPNNTVLDWTGSAAGTNGITFNQGSHFGVENLTLVNAPGTNLLINNGSLGTANYCNVFHVRNVRMQGAGVNNFAMFNTFMGEISNCWSFGAGGVGYLYGGFHTSIKTSRCEANANTGVGWSLNGLTYSEFSSCGSDSNGSRGWSMTNMNAVTFNSCGAEENQNDAYALLTSTASTTGIPAQSQDIHGVVFNGCFSTANSVATPGAFGGFIVASTQDSRPIDFIINGGASWPNDVADKALILAGTSGAITVHKSLFNDSGYTAADSLSGSTEVKNFTLSGRSTLATLSSATQSISNNTLTDLSLSTSASVNTLGATISSNHIVMPRGVNKVRVSVNINFAADVNGTRQLFVQKNGANVIGLPSVAISANSSGGTIITAVSQDISVVAGDYFSCQVYQNSGGALNVVRGTTTYLGVEAVC